MLPEPESASSLLEIESQAGAPASSSCSSLRNDDGGMARGAGGKQLPLTASSSLPEFGQPFPTSAARMRHVFCEGFLLFQLAVRLWSFLGVGELRPQGGVGVGAQGLGRGLGDFSGWAEWGKAD